MKPSITVVISQGASNHPAKRAKEFEIADCLSGRWHLDVLVVSNLCDLLPQGETFRELRAVSDHLIVFSWFYPRAAHWILDRHGISGQRGTSLLRGEGDEDQADEAAEYQGGEPVERVIDTRPLPSRSIYCIDLRACESVDAVGREVERILSEVGGAASRGLAAVSEGNGSRPWRQITEETQRRWYPVIDFSRCTNCMECIDFCLFGVYGVDRFETILVEQPDSCRKGCPACSRVCPENAIMFPQHKAPAIAGASSAVDGLKIDLSQLFGGPEPTEVARQTAARERAEQLIADGREPGEAPSSRTKPAQESETESDEELDTLLEMLDDFDR
jgi:NAD-dependent dihydropyrimidine dehydrogenase PreA subunit